jgi:hypothetical protein
MNVEFSVVDVSKLSQLTSKPRPELSLGMSLGDIRLLPRWCPAYRQHEPGPGSRMERVKAGPDTDVPGVGRERRTPSGGIREEQSTEAGPPADSPVVAVNRLRIAVGRGAKGRGRSGWCAWSTVREEPRESARFIREVA